MTQIYPLPSDLHIGHRGHEVARLTEAIPLAAGELSLLVGLNGAGKTTLMKTICGIIPPLAGKIPDARTFYLPEDLEFPGELTPAQIAAATLCLDAEARAWSERIAEQLGVMRNKPYAHLSKGNRQKVRVWLSESIARQRGCVLLCLDEPMTGLDCQARDALMGLWESDRTVRRIISLHPSELPSHTDRIIVVSGQKINAIPGDTKWENIRPLLQ
jgi:iron complex transport system ATP-binding protein